MNSTHKSDESVRAYLLGTLGELEASELEASYFLDPARLRWLESIEDALIGDYLHDRLARADRQRFEARYLEVPVLQQRLEAVRSRILLNAQAKRAGAWPMLRIALVCMALLALGIGTWRYQLVPQAIVATAARKIAAVPVASFSIRLAPGVSKGAHTGAQEFAIPPAIGKVSLTLELPGPHRSGGMRGPAAVGRFCRQPGSSVDQPAGPIAVIRRQRRVDGGTAAICPFCPATTLRRFSNRPARSSNLTCSASTETEVARGDRDRNRSCSALAPAVITGLSLAIFMTLYATVLHLTGRDHDKSRS